MTTPDSPSASPDRAWVITGPTSGFGRRTALELARARRRRARRPRPGQARRGQPATSRPRVAARRRFSPTSPTSPARAAQRPRSSRATCRSPGCSTTRGSFPAADGPQQGWDLVLRHQPPRPASRSPTRSPAPAGRRPSRCSCAPASRTPNAAPRCVAGFRGARYLSVEASARWRVWSPGGSSRPGMDAYATSKQGNLAPCPLRSPASTRAALPRVEPGVNPGSASGSDASAASSCSVEVRCSPALAPAVQVRDAPRSAPAG